MDAQARLGARGTRRPCSATRTSDEDQAGELDGLEPYCAVCGADIGIFIGHGDAWLHYTGEGTPENPVELYDAGHAPEVDWRPAGGVS